MWQITSNKDFITALAKQVVGGIQHFFLRANTSGLHWLAAIVLTSPLYLLAGINHIIEMIVKKNILRTIQGQ